MRVGISRHSLYHHAQRHIGPELRQALASKILKRKGELQEMVAEESGGIVETLRALRGPLWRRFVVVAGMGDERAMCLLAARIHENLQLAAKITGELQPHTTTSVTNILLSPDFQRFRAQLLRAVLKHPAAYRDVMMTFHEAGEEVAAQIDGHASTVIDAR